MKINGLIGFLRRIVLFMMCLIGLQIAHLLFNFIISNPWRAKNFKLELTLRIDGVFRIFVISCESGYKFSQCVWGLMLNSFEFECHAESPDHFPPFVALVADVAFENVRIINLDNLKEIASGARCECEPIKRTVEMYAIWDFKDEYP